MEINILRVIPRRLRDGRLINRDAVCTFTVQPKWRKVDFASGKLDYQEYAFEIRWPIILQLQLHIAHYRVGGLLSEHIDEISPGERQFRIQFIPRNAKRGGELVCERFILNWRNFKIFEPARYRHEITRVEEGERFVFNFGIRYAFSAIRPCPF